MSEAQAPYGVADVPEPHPSFVTLVDKVTYCRAVQFDGSDESIDAMRLLTGVPTLELCLDGTAPYVNLTVLDCLANRLYVGEWLVDGGGGVCTVVQDSPLAHLSRPGTLNFSQAVQLLLDGYKVRRSGWCELMVYMDLPPNRYGLLWLRQRNSSYTTYCLQPGDLTATDWQLVAGEEGVYDT